MALSKSLKMSPTSQLINYQQVLDYLPNYVLWLNTNGIISGCNDKTPKLFGLKSKNKILGKKYSDLSKALKLPSSIFDLFDNNFRNVINDGKTFEHKLLLGNTFLSCIHKPLIDNNKTIGVIVELIDITKFEKSEKKLEKTLKKAEDKIKSIELELNRVLKYMPCNVYWVDKKSANLGCNDNLAINYLGFNSREEVKGLTYFDMAKIRNWPIEQAKLWRKDDLEVLKTGKPNENINYLTDSNGEPIYQTTNRAPLCDEEGNVIGVIGISTDITERIKKIKELGEAKERAEIANQAKSDFLATVSHELRTPLNGIIGMADLLTRQNITNEQKMFVQDIINSGKSLLSLINGILDLSKLEAGEFEIINSPFDLTILINEAITQVSTQAQQKNITLSTKIEGDFPSHLLGDSQRLYQILINLLGNAVKFTDKGKIDLTISCIERNKKKITLSFIVKDTGIGIPKNQLNLIFERFRQLDQTFSRRHSGTGLGLAIVKQLVELMHGEVTVESKMNKGTKFTVNLSFTPQPERAKSNLWLKNHPNIRILIVEDDLTVGTKILKLIHTPCVSLVSSSSLFETLENAAKRNQHYQILIFSQKILSQDSENVEKLKKSLPHLHFPMIVAYSDKQKGQKKAINLNYNTISIAESNDAFITQLCKLWKEYELRLSEFTSDFVEVNPKILLVEDNVINQRVTSHLLKELGCDFDIADNGILAIKLFKKNKYDLILMDIGLPDMDGYVVTKKIRNLEKKNNHIPIIALTAYASENDRQKCLDSGMDNVLTKPINRTGLTNMLSAWLLST